MTIIETKNTIKQNVKQIENLYKTNTALRNELKVQRFHEQMKELQAKMDFIKTNPTNLHFNNQKTK